MDSNFQVRISANISDLQNSIKSAQATLAQLKQTTDGVSTSMKNMENNANRGRLVAFAFGQVIRDAGFFSQSFALGLLAISNNIPILVDQLAQMANLSQKAMSAVSLLGSALTAGLTIYAYYAQTVKDANAEYNKALAESTKTSKAQVANIMSLVSIAQDEELSYNQRKQAIDELNKSNSQLNNQLTVNNINTQRSIDLIGKLTESIELQAKAQAIAGLIGEEYARQVKAQNSSLEDQASIIAKIGSYAYKAFGNEVAAATLLANSGAQEFSKTMTSSEANVNKYGTELDKINKKLVQNGAFTDYSKVKLSDYQQALKNLSDTLKQLGADNSLTFDERNRQKIDAYRNAIQDLSTINSNQAKAKIDELRISIFELNKEVLRAEGNKFAAKLFSIKVSQDATDATNAEKQAAEELSSEWERG